ncbi:MAG: peptidoglycan DD-metalloendopeptidase family protein [Chloroflexota bacterium]
MSGNTRADKPARQKKTAMVIIFLIFILLVVFFLFSRQKSRPGLMSQTPIPITFGTTQGEINELPQIVATQSADSLTRRIEFDTELSDRTRYDVISYTVIFGDSLFGIAKEFSITPESLLWANESTLGSNPDLLEPGMEITIPPVDGVYYQWQFGDTFESVSGFFSVTPVDIFNWVGNPIVDLSNPIIAPGEWVMIPGGKGEFQQWVIPVIPSGAAGVSPGLYGTGACAGNYNPGLGTGSFAWPSHLHDIVGNDYWSGHLALDIATGEGLAITAADTGVVVFSGWANGGYGYMVMLDHGNGYHTLYAHMSSVNAQCGQSIAKGQALGFGGSTGNSTGPHLHFELRFLGGFANPWTVLPPQ